LNHLSPFLANLLTKLHFQSPWLFRLELDRAKMVDRKLTIAYVAGRIAETFQTDLFVIWSEDNSEKLIIRCRVMGSPDKEDDGSAAIEEDVFLRQLLENTMLSSVALRGVQGINQACLVQYDKVTITNLKESNIDAQSEKEWVLETDGEPEDGRGDVH
jgi:DNA-directed RNA polymerase II subunit RPB1